MDTSKIIILEGEKSAVININTKDKAIASIATASNIAGDGMITIYTWWPILNQWLKILSSNLTPAVLPIQKNMSSIFVPGIDLRGETQIKIEFSTAQLNDVTLEVKFCYL